jgi:uncharacterized membrane protein
MDLNTILAGINTMNNITSTALITLQALFFMTMLFMLAVFVFIIWLTMQIWKKPNKSENQTQQQASNTQQSDNRNVSVDYKTLDIIKSSIVSGIAFIILIFIIALVAYPLATDILGYQAALVMILLVAAVSIPILYDGYSQVNKLLPKRIKKIIKVTTVYEDGTTIEKERRYEY